MPKRPKHRATVTAEKRPRSVPSARDGQITISFSLFDHATEWCKEYDSGSLFHVVAKKLRNYESMRWTEIIARDHSVPLGKLVPRARRRLIELKLDDVDELWRFKLNGLKRLWGIRVGDCFYALWWDPEHAVCPSKLKHT